uniref:sugar transferase n=1 Tax=Microbacterium sp. CJ77 TaxID=2079201 RepID=UPI000CD9EC96
RSAHRAPADRRWPRRYAQRLFFSDVFIVLVVCLTFGVILTAQRFVASLWPNGPDVGYMTFMLAVALIWIACLDAFDTRDERYVGHGVLEYRRIVAASVGAFSLIIAVGFFMRTEMSRPMFITVLPAGLALLLFSRWLWRQWLRRQQADHRYVNRALIVGERSKVDHTARAIARTHGTGFDLIGAVTPSGRAVSDSGQLQVLGDFSRLISVMDEHRIDTLILVGSDDLNPRTMRSLGWQLADRDVQLVVAPALTDIAGPRVHSRPVAGLPLIHVTYPTLEGGRRVAKRTFDIIGSALLITLFSGALLAVAIAVKLSSPGPVLYRQERVGRRGKRFGMLKFRSMVQDADDQLASLLDAQGTSDQPLFKVTNDPRITPVGKFIRKYSLDELPQLLNVMRGQMSLVGPRPQRPAEVALYDDEAHRRLLVKPGMSGLWQVNGRSALSWEDALRFDLYYIENWSFTQDLLILFRTIKAVAQPGSSAH